MVGRRNNHGIHFVPQFRQQLTIVGKVWHARKRCVRFVKSSRIDVAEADEFDAGM